MTGRVERGRFAEFLEAADGWRAFREDRGWVVPEVLQGLSGEMNSVLLVFRYPDLAAYEREEEQGARDREYARVAMRMPFEGPLRFRIYRRALPEPR